MSAPSTFRAGDSAGWTIDLPEYPAADGWVLTYRMLWTTGTAIDLPTTAAGAAYTVALTSADTAAWPAGAATLVHWVEKGAERVTLGAQSVSIAPDLTTAATHDGRSLNRRALDDARAALAAHMASGRAHVESYTIAGRSMKFRSVQELRDLIAYYEAEVAKESAARAAYAGVAGGRIFTRM